MTVDDRKVLKLRTALEKLRRGKNVQNRQLQTLLGEDGYAGFLEDWQQQQELRDTLQNKPTEIVEYERRLKEAEFTYGKADAASRRGRRAAAKSLFAQADTQFERLAEFIAEQIAGNLELELWFDRSVHFDASNTPSSSADDFPCVVTSRSLRNMGGGLLIMKKSKRQLKIDAIERELNALKCIQPIDEEIAARLAAAKKLKALVND